MTEAEESAMKEARSILALHFDAFSISTRTADDDGKDRINSDWHGALSDVIGMHHMTALRLDYIALYGKLPDGGPHQVK